MTERTDELETVITDLQTVVENWYHLSSDAKKQVVMAAKSELKAVKREMEFDHQESMKEGYQSIDDELLDMEQELDDLENEIEEDIYERDLDEDDNDDDHVGVDEWKDLFDEYGNDHYLDSIDIPWWMFYGEVNSGYGPSSESVDDDYYDEGGEHDE